MTTIIVPGAGRTPNDVFLVGEAPGREEAYRRRPFVGRSGREQDVYLGRFGLNARQWYMSNVVKQYIDGNPDPTPELVEEWTPVLEDEIETVQPRLIIAVGRFAARWFLGDSVDMELVHGLPHRAGAFDITRKGRAGGAVVVPVYHPAMGLYDNEARNVIAWDYGQAAITLKMVQGDEHIKFPEDLDTHADRERYLDVTGVRLARVIAERRPDVIAIDTEGYPTAPWSIQISIEPGTGYVLRTSDVGFRVGIEMLQARINGGATVVLHNAMFDIEMCRAMGLDLRDAKIWDSMYAAYLMRFEPQGLKPLAWRWCGMRMRDYSDVVGGAGLDKQISYLYDVSELDWPLPESRKLFLNDGTTKDYKPQPIHQRVKAILRDVETKPGTDPYDRWQAVDVVQRQLVEDVLGPMPIGTLDDVPLPEAIAYSVRDADATLRLYHALRPALARRDHPDILMDGGMEVLPLFEQMQANGMPASRSRFQALSDRMWEEMQEIQADISINHFDGRPFNPGSHPQVATLMRRLGLEGAKRTGTGKVSTGTKSIKHLESTSTAIAKVFQWRERQKIRDAFCTPILDRMREQRLPADVDIAPVRCQIKVTRVHTRRLAAADPNLLAIPVRHDLGVQVRDCYVCPEGEVFGGWDLSQVEMRWAAHLANDELMIKWILGGRDIHNEVAAVIFGISLSDLPGNFDKLSAAGRKDALKERYANIHPKNHRYPAKRAGFGIITNIQGVGLFDQLRMYGCEGWDERSCQRLIDDWLGVFKGIKAYLWQCRVDARRYGMVRDAEGMPRYLAGVWSPDAPVRAEAERTASSHRIQGGAQGMMQRSLGWLYPRIRKLQDQGKHVLPCLQVHDELILRFRKNLWPVLDPLVRTALTQHHGQSLRVPLEAEGHMSTTWGGLK